MIHVLRLGHRPPRDARVTTHVALTARALGADGITIAEHDPRIERTIRDVTQRFGGSFTIETGVAWKPFLKRWKTHGTVIHLTMYGEALGAVLPRLSAEGDVLLVVGAEKVPAELYDLTTFNVAIGNQPHSEVAALAIAIDRLTAGAWEGRDFSGRVRIVPSARGKRLIEAPLSVRRRRE